MGKEISLKTLFLCPTIEQLAKKVIEKSYLKSTITDIKVTHLHQNIKEAQIKIPDSPHCQIERYSLLSLWATKQINAVDSVALAYVSQSWLDKYQLNKNNFAHTGFENLPFLSRIIQTHWGRIGIVILPHLSEELYNNHDSLLDSVIKALHLSKIIGAKAVSLTGLLPSATNYGYDILHRISPEDNLPKITTGHDTTSATVVLSIANILQQAGRKLNQETVAFIGLGSVGISTLRLMLKCLPHPHKLILCDLYSKKSHIEAVSQELIYELDFKGKISIAVSQPDIPPEIYQASLIIGATNVPDVLDINLVKSGTLIVDDSGPHCFDPKIAIQRFEKKNDILFTEGGVLHLPIPHHRLIHIPQQLPTDVAQNLVNSFSQFNSNHLTGCVFSSLLCSKFDHLKPTIGNVSLTESQLNYETLIKLNCRGADLHCQEYLLSPEIIAKFRSLYGET